LGWSDGMALSEDGTASSDETSLYLLPLTASVTYRFDWLAQKWNIPIVPYGKVGFTYTIWWVTTGSGEISNTYDLEGTGRAGYGGTFGFHVAGGFQILLDWAAPTMAAEFDNEVGVNNSYLFFEYGFHSVNDFGSSTSFDLGDDTFSAGMMFEF
ncbi:MAG: MXAN_2562 family outer membrane beta-barrel protein, partial [Myxococcota bacterium]|nr:MXAN_2562 family outer membrane beta-barrel protein [Myxococcota bacterium]